jgi:hypothetical protein
MKVNLAVGIVGISPAIAYELESARKPRCFRVGVGLGCVLIGEEHLVR